MTNSPPSPSHGINHATLTHIVLAGNFREYRHWLLASGVPTEKTLYVGDQTSLYIIPADLTGEKGIKVVIVGTFHLRKDRNEILDMVRVRFPRTTPENHSTS